MQDTIEKVKDTIVEETTSILDYKFVFSQEIGITVRGLIFVVVALIVTSYILQLIRRFITRKMPQNDKQKFVTVFGYVRWFVFLIIFLVTMNTSGVDVTAVFAASAALLIGVGLALQTLFQDIISGIFILVDQSVHVGDIIELEGKVGRVLDIRLRTTRAVTVDNKVLVIPNHLYLTNILFNWTENGSETRESVSVGVAYGTDVEKVKRILLDIAKNQPTVLKNPAPVVLFTDFADSSLNFKIVFTLNNSFEVRFTQSNIRFEIDKAFKQNNISIPFPQRDVHLFTQK
ncbi:mechanosensitive ion channel protein MscS [Polaribacter reichenbachii]|uniref:Mechanosensitive ion channel protein MscS n=1 Tax=Polaribacter reichenbachii TaxID=996801 RepID=A0A1B8U2A3_9FLAO|nr:mechanosensitive ion channel domain-containing protein [Polaribacter reichenbachii]APZ44805.1 mechanosensitive ion channel protein MscS [Polaribacter reichenbachii]AUC18669.1 mechanosensitive ion channel protein MscS [Polaribacter reichenbachii]OBY65996.1 mechanosensitive ion channel protein MscS [Polaribacter reichenbachii]